MLHIMIYVALVFASATNALYASSYPYRQIVLWGHKLHSHTHSYIHYGFFKAFQHLGYTTHWLDKNDDVRHLDLSNSLFITEGQVDDNIPLRDDCFYILHNCKPFKYQDLWRKGRCINLQVYTDDVLDRPGLTKIATCIYYDFSNRIVYMPWATDLLPHEIDALQNTPSLRKKISTKNKTIYWVGTIGEGTFGNAPELAAFKKGCSKEKIQFKQVTHSDPQQSVTLIQQSYMAPAIVGAWQQKVGYIPCRIFKNISYGKMGITNSERVYELFDRKIVFDPDCYQLFMKAHAKLQTIDQAEIDELVHCVKTHHTYLNRIDLLLSFIEKAQITYAQK